MGSIYIERTMVPAAIRGMSKKRRWRVVITTTVRVPMDAGLWSGGTREEYSLVRLSDGATLPNKLANTSPWNSARQDVSFELPSGVVILKSGHFCGKPATPTIYARPEDIAPALPAPVA